MAVVSTLEYYERVTITAEKSFIIQDRSSGIKMKCFVANISFATKHFLCVAILLSSSLTDPQPKMCFISDNVTKHDEIF
jgi:hypothetical protein